MKKMTSFLKGSARIADLTAIIDMKRLKTDQEALLQDWKAVGHDMEHAIKLYEKEYGQKTAKKKQK